MKGIKTGGRQKGTPNKATLVIGTTLERRGINLAEEALKLYDAATDLEFKLKVIALLMPYVHPRKVEVPADDSLDVTPDDMDIDEMKRLFISASKGIEELKEKIEEKERGQS